MNKPQNNVLPEKNKVLLSNIFNFTSVVVLMIKMQYDENTIIIIAVYSRNDNRIQSEVGKIWGKYCPELQTAPATR